MKYTNLKDSPEFVQKTYKLIENSFEYTSENSFSVDFYPLMKKENHSNCFIYIDGDIVVAHIGVLTRVLPMNKDEVSIAMYGGIAVNESYRGKGIFKNLFNEIQNGFKTVALHLLWSEKLDLYKKYNFHPCVDLYEYQKEISSHNFNIIKTRLNELTQEEISVLSQLYNESSELRIKRDTNSWEELSHIVSADLFLIKEKNKIINYFIMNKGQDLDGIVHEYGLIDKSYLKLFRSYGNVWTPFNSKIESINMFATIIKIGDGDSFKKFIKNYSNISINRVSSEKVEFNFQENSFSLDHDEFLQGVFGPGRFKEINATPLFISGLDSI
jgi:predicted acetyltransferase